MSADRDEVLKEISDTLKKYYWESRQVPYSGLPGAQVQKVPKEDAGAPLMDLAAYLVSARKEKMEKSEACYYGGTKLLYSVLGRTNRRWSSSVEETNDLWRLGRKTSEYLWGLLEKHGDSKGYWGEIDHLAREVQKCFKGASR